MTIEKYLLSVKDLYIQNTNVTTLPLDSCFHKMLIRCGNEVPACMYNGFKPAVPLVLPPIQKEVKSINSAFMITGNVFNWYLSIWGVKVNGEIIYLGNNIILDSDGIPLMLPVVVKEGEEKRLVFYFHSKITRQDTYIAKTLYRKFIPIILSDGFCNEWEGCRMARLLCVRKTTVAFDDLSKFILTSKVRRPSNIQDFDFGKLVIEQLDNEDINATTYF